MSYTVAFRITEKQYLFVEKDGRINFGHKVNINTDPDLDPFYRFQRGIPVFISIDDYDEHTLGNQIAISEVCIVFSWGGIVTLPFEPVYYSSLREAYQNLAKLILNAGFPVFWLSDERVYSDHPMIPAH